MNCATNRSYSLSLVAALSAAFGAALSLSNSTFARAEHTRVTNPTAVGVELLGRGMAYSFFFDRVLSDDLSAGFGYGNFGLSGGAAASSGVVPAYFNYYFARQQGSVYATGGVSLLTDSTKGAKSTVGNLTLSSPIVPVVGLGYENRSDAGYLFRVTAYGLVGETLVPWGGFSFGYSF